MEFAAIFQWIALGQKVMAGGSAVYASVKAALAAHGIEADTDQLDAVIADAEKRKAMAEAETQATS
jgi:hypothetical protein